MRNSLLQRLRARKWTLLNFLLGFAGVVAIISLIMPFFIGGPNRGETWAVAAAALAVLTSIISAWASQQTVEMEEAKQKPYPYPFIDAESRHGLLLFRVTNFGAQTAHDIYLQWETPLMVHEGNKVSFSGCPDGPDIEILLPGHSIATIIGPEHRVFESSGTLVYNGAIKFKDDLGAEHQYPFIVSLQQYRKTVLYDQEQSRTQYELQKIPQLLKDLVKAVGEVGDELKNGT